jgi:hypothetical protein
MCSPQVVTHPIIYSSVVMQFERTKTCPVMSRVRRKYHYDSDTGLLNYRDIDMVFMVVQKYKNLLSF